MAKEPKRRSRRYDNLKKMRGDAGGRILCQACRSKRTMLTHITCHRMT